MHTKTSNIRELTRSFLYVIVLGLLLSFPTVGRAAPIAFSFLKLVDTNTPIPGGSGNFTGFVVPSLDDGTGAFVGDGLSGQIGIYTATPGGPITRVVDRSVSIPGGVGNFTNFANPIHYHLTRGSLRSMDLAPHYKLASIRPL